jgi:hypothetical protein
MTDAGVAVSRETEPHLSSVDVFSLPGDFDSIEPICWAWRPKSHRQNVFKKTSCPLRKQNIQQAPCRLTNPHQWCLGLVPVATRRVHGLLPPTELGKYALPPSILSEV